MHESGEMSVIPPGGRRTPEKLHAGFTCDGVGRPGYPERVGPQLKHARLAAIGGVPQQDAGAPARPMTHCKNAIPF